MLRLQQAWMLQLLAFAATVAYLLISNTIFAGAFLAPTYSESSIGSSIKFVPNDVSHTSHRLFVFVPSSTVLHLTPERYNINTGNPDPSDSDEELFLSLANDSRRGYDGTVACDVKAPTPELAPEDVVPLLMNALKNNDIPTKDAGMMLVWEFASDTTKYIFKNNITEFIESCHETADEFPTSFYGAAMYGHSWDLETKLNRVGGEEGWIATQVMRTISSDGRLRRWQWELRKNKRPPCLGCWKVESIGSSDRNGDFEARDRGDGWSD